MSKIIAYVGNNEIIVTTEENEAATIKEYFTDLPDDRDIDNYDREVYSKNFTIESSMRTRWGE